MRIKAQTENHDHLNNIELRSDIENDNINGEYLIFKGKTSSNPDTWTISIADSVIDYHYDNQTEYEEDIQILIQ